MTYFFFFGGWGGGVGGGGLLTLTLELWQIDIFLILMWNNITICRIMQLIFRNRNTNSTFLLFIKITSQWRHYIAQSVLFITCTFYFHASYTFCLGRLNNVLHSRFGFGFCLTFLLPSRYIYISHLVSV